MRDREQDIDLHPELEDTNLAGRPDEATVFLEEQREIVTALAQIPSEQRTLIELTYFKGYTQSELAEHFKIPLGTVKTRMRTGMSSLCTQLQHLI